jgi:hypothetical protein
MQLNRGRFRDNGNCGYLLRPPFHQPTESRKRMEKEAKRQQQLEELRASKVVASVVRFRFLVSSNAIPSQTILFKLSLLIDD